ncbi:hypothetical protein [Actinacidiphila acididurans]|uniref:Uncharacterized protein n=1 Tax=Actinacidiphila acididurans TaxID=2784346 RepID=A0ABS2TPF7_9ACTN|nr:hypothetical protein [Actinacidiphila acididurans]MBM9504386.1 hypothetical protein [Actinacidiphila acididurans]
MTSDTARPRWWIALRSFLGFFVGGGLGSFAYQVVSHRPLDGMPWGWLLFGSIVCGALSALFPGRGRR